MAVINTDQTNLDGEGFTWLRGSSPPSREAEARTEGEAMEDGCLLACSQAYICLIQARPRGPGVTLAMWVRFSYSSQENPPWDNLMEFIFQLRFFLPKCVSNQD